MRRKQFRTICENIEWLESPEDHELIVPSKRLFSPNLSKSAPCKCCPSGGHQNFNCGSCATDARANAPYTLADSFYGGSVTMTGGTAPILLTGSQNVSATGSVTSPACCDSVPITMNIVYELDCGSTLAGFLCLWARASGCNCGSFGWRGDVSVFGTRGIGALAVCKQIDATHPLDCTFASPGITFHFNASPGTNGVYPSGANVTISK